MCCKVSNVINAIVASLLLAHDSKDIKMEEEVFVEEIADEELEEVPLAITNSREKTERLPLVKLELTGDVKKQMEVVQQKVYDFGLQIVSRPAAAVKDSTKWQTTDEHLYRDAKEAYDRIIRLFMDEPKVFNIAAVKERVWELNKLHNADVIPDHGDQSTVGSQKSFRGDGSPIKKTKKKRKKKHVDDASSDGGTDGGREGEGKAGKLPNVLDTFINPFEIGTMDEIWKEKLELLEKLTPREDLDGYEYREDFDDQQYRFSLQNDFTERLRVEVERRANYPTLVEQVEDVLFDLVESVVINVEVDKGQYINERMEKIMRVRHPTTREFKLKRLPAIEDDKGDKSFILSDLEFQDIVISPAGFTLAPSIPRKTLLLHEQEREYAREMKKREEIDREANRRLPLTMKLRTAIAKAKVDRNVAVREAMRSIVDTAVVLPSRPVRNLLTDYFQRTKSVLAKITSDPVDTFQEFLQSIADKVEDLRAKSIESNYKPEQSTAKALLEEAKKQMKAKVAMQTIPPETKFEAPTFSNIGSIPNEFPDAVMITFKINYDVPPAYVIRHRRTVKLEVEKLSKRARELAIKYHLIDPKDVKSGKLAANLAKNGSSAQVPAQSNRLQDSVVDIIAPVAAMPISDDPYDGGDDIAGAIPLSAAPAGQSMTSSGALSSLLSGVNFIQERVSTLRPHASVPKESPPDSSVENPGGLGVEEEEEKEDEEVIPLKRIVGSANYTGFLGLEDMITPKVKVG